MDLQPLVKSFLKGIGAKPETLGYVDAFFSVKWEKPFVPGSNDLEAFVDLSGGAGHVQLNGLDKNGKWISVLIQCEDPNMIPAELRAKMAGGK